MFSLIILAAIAAAAAQNKVPPPHQFRVIYEWNAIDFEWDSAHVQEVYRNTSQYIPENVLISGINYYENKLFLTLPRMMEGVPATLATIPVEPVDTSPKLKPFPSWEQNKIGDCESLQFVQNIEIDKNGIMWILDNGRVGTLTPKPDPKCPPSLVLIDLKTGENKMERIPFPAETVNPNTTYLNDLVVDNRYGDYAYITDNSAVDPGIIVFRRRDKKSWKLRDRSSMTSVPEASFFRINGTGVNLPVNIDGIALGPQYMEEDKVDRKVYYCPLSSFYLYSISASALQNETLATEGGDALRIFIDNVGRKASQTDGMKMDANGTLYYGLIGNSTISEWNSTMDFNAGQRTVAKDANYIQWIDRFTFDNRGNVYAVINRLYNFVKNWVSLDEVNYRILRAHTGSKSYVFGKDLTGSVPQQSAAAAPTFAASLVLLAVAQLLA